MERKFLACDCNQQWTIEHAIGPTAGARASTASDKDCRRGSVPMSMAKLRWPLTPHAPGVPQYSRFPRQAAPAARMNHGDVTLPWS
jgi:hypothetical protein